VFCPRLPLADYLGRYGLAYLFLDTWPYNAHTRAADALWAGLPVLSWPGGSFASRVAASQLRAADVPELVADGVGDYVALATRIGTDPGLAASLRRRVAERVRSSRLFATPRHARQLEQAFEEMADRLRSGQPPAGFDLSPD
jgi:predicted O-linked N-acetylglucosamine transferase (SPINDLY family)